MTNARPKGALECGSFALPLTRILIFPEMRLRWKLPGSPCVSSNAVWVVSWGGGSGAAAMRKATPVPGGSCNKICRTFTRP